MSVEKHIEEMDCKKCLHYEMCLETFRKGKEEGLWEHTEEEEYFAHADECDFYAAGYRKASEVALEVINNLSSRVQIMVSAINAQAEEIGTMTEFNGGAKTALEVVFTDLADLKKKYAESEKDNGEV